MKLAPRSHPQLLTRRKTDADSLRDWIARHLEAPVPGADVPPQLLAARLGRNLKTISLAGWRTPGLDRVERELRNIHPSEGLERIVEIIRRAPGFEVLDGGHISFDEVLTGSPEMVRARWRDALHSQLSDTALALATADPTRELDTVLPVGTTFDLTDLMLEREARESELYWKLYGNDLRNSWVGTIVERRGTRTWTLTMWHLVTDAGRRLELRSALTRLASSLRVACDRIGLFRDAQAGEIQVVQSLNEAGLQLPQLPEAVHARSQFIKGSQLEPGTGLDSGFGNRSIHGTINPNRLILKEKPGTPSSAAERSIEELWAERERLWQALQETEEALLARLKFAGAIPVRTFSATAVQLIKRFDTDPRPVVIYVAGTDRTCILKPADPNDLPTEIETVGKIGQRGSRLVQRVSMGGAHSDTRVGISRGGGSNKKIVAELCPANADSNAHIDVLRKLGGGAVEK